MTLAHGVGAIDPIGERQARMEIKHMLLRQGDVLLRRIGDAPADLKTSDALPVLAEGEVSGHLHRMYGGAVMFRDDALARSLGAQAYIGTVDVPAAGGELRHVLHDGRETGEHDTILVPAGRYAAIAQREYDPEGERRAQD